MFAIHWLRNIALKVVRGRDMAQVVSRPSMTSEARVRAFVSPYVNCGGQSGTGTGFPPSSSVFPDSIIPPWLSIVIYHLAVVQRHLTP